MKRPGLSRSSKITFAVWLVVALTMSVVLGVVMYRGLPVESDLLALLPKDERSHELSVAIDAFQNRLGERTLVLVGVPANADLTAAVTAVCASLKDSAAFAEVTCSRNFDASKTFELISSHRWQLLPRDAVAQLEKGDAQAFLDDAQAQVFSPMGAGRAALLTKDPLGLTFGFLTGLERPGVSVDTDTGIAWVEGEGRRWGIIDARNKKGAFSEGGPEHVVRSSEAAGKAAPAGTEVLGMGIAFHAAAAAKVAKQEMSTIGLGSWIGSILLVLFVFRTARSLVLSSLAIGMGMMGGLLATIAVFGHVHVLTLVLGSSLAGVAIDYALHVMSDSFQETGHWDAEEAVRRLRWPLFLGMATSVLAYASLAATPFPGLRELALFATAALSTAFLTVIASFPVLLKGYRAWSTRPRDLAFAGLLRIDALFAKRTLMVGLLGVGIVLSAIGLLRLRTEDDIHTFQNPDPVVTQAENRARALFSSVPESQFFLVTGPTADAVLTAETKLAPSLEALAEKGALGSFQMVSKHVAPAAVQEHNVELLRAHVYSSPALAEYFDSLGFKPETVAAEKAAFESAHSPLTVDAWLASAPGEGDRVQWLGQTSPGTWASVVLLHGIRSISDLAAINSPGAVLVDRTAEISELMARSRRWALALVGVAFVAMWVLMAFRYGKRGALRTLVPTAMACVVALAGAGWLGLPLNMFSTVALWLVLGMGVDYSIFFREAGDDARTTTIGVLVDSITTLLSFGLLAISQTPALRSFGTVLSLGLASAFLFAPLARTSAQRIHVPNPQ